MKKYLKRLLCSVLSIILAFSCMVYEIPALSAGAGSKVFDGGQRDFKWPVPGCYGLSSCFIDGRSHYAIDIYASSGTAVVASYDGVVVEVTYNGSNDSGYGNAVMVKHDYVSKSGVKTLYTRYAHLSSIAVSVGQKVYAGQTKIGAVGGSGYGNDNYYVSHLDFQILTSTNWRNRSTCSIDPFVNELLELPSGIYTASNNYCCGVGPKACCCYKYLEDVKAIYAKKLNTSPKGCLDLLTGGENSISIAGWAFDPDKPDATVTLHVYIDGVHTATCYANHRRDDVHKAYSCGQYHGFSETVPFNVTTVGTHKVSIYALDYTYGAMATALTVSADVTISPDLTAPVITNVKVSDVSETGYTVTCTVNDANGIDRVQFPTWTALNGQDDIQSNWQTSTVASGIISGNEATYRVNISDHNNETGKYNTHIYAYDKYGNRSACCETLVAVGGDVFTPVAEMSNGTSKYVLYDASIRSWTVAKTYCESLGGYLATIESEEEEKLIESLITSGSADGYWLGATDEVEEGKWVWVNGNAMSYNKWGENQPDNCNGNQNHLYYNVSNAKWDDIDKLDTTDTLKYGFIMEYEDNAIEPTTTPTPSTLPSEWPEELEQYADVTYENNTAVVTLYTKAFNAMSIGVVSEKQCDRVETDSTFAVEMKKLFHTLRLKIIV